jgi:hypothetical protein
MFKLSYYVFDFENKYCCLFLINKGTLLYDYVPRYKSEGVRGRWGELREQLNVYSGILLMLYVSIRKAGYVVKCN